MLIEVPMFVMERLEILSRGVERLADVLAAPWEYRRVVFTWGKAPLEGADETHPYDDIKAVLGRLGGDGWEVYLTQGGVDVGPVWLWLKRRACR